MHAQRTNHLRVVTVLTCFCVWCTETNCKALKFEKEWFTLFIFIFYADAKITLIDLNIISCIFLTRNILQGEKKYCNVSFLQYCAALP